MFLFVNVEYRRGRAPGPPCPKSLALGLGDARGAYVTVLDKCWVVKMYFLLVYVIMRWNRKYVASAVNLLNRGWAARSSNAS